MTLYRIEKIPGSQDKYRIVTNTGKVIDSKKGPMDRLAAGKKLAKLRSQKPTTATGGARGSSRRRSSRRGSRKGSRRGSRRA